MTALDQANYESTIETTATPNQVFRAITAEMDRWWTTDTDGSVASVGDTVRVDFPPNNGHWTFRATALVPGKLVELTCTDAFHVVAGQPAEIEKEWLETVLRWHISAKEGGTEVRFEHQGLTSKLNCYDTCYEGWNFFFATSFAAYLNEGTGMPHSARV